MRRASVLVIAALGVCAAASAQQTPPAGRLPSAMAQVDPTQGLTVNKVVPGIRYVEGRNVSSNTFVVDTSEGAVIIDTSRPPVSRAHFDLLQKEGVKSAKYVILTHGHGDHTGGALLWKGTGAKIVTQKLFPEFLDYQRMLAGFFAARNGAQFQFAGSAGAAARQAPGQAANISLLNAPQIKPDVTFDDKMELTVGDTKFELMHTPGETPEMLTVWVPKLKAAFVGDNYYESFPNMYTLRGTKPRWPLDYITSLEKVMALEPEVVLPSHGPPIVGKEKAHAALKKMHDAIVYVHEAVLKGMNEGKGVHELMQTIHLPKELDVGEGYGKISWSVRGIYEGYAGWFSGDPADMFEKGRESVSVDLVQLAGGGKAIADRAMKLLGEGKEVEALQMTSIGLEGAPGDKDVLKARAAAFEALLKSSTNRNEQGWLQQGLAQARAKLGAN